MDFQLKWKRKTKMAKMVNYHALNRINSLEMRQQKIKVLIVTKITKIRMELNKPIKANNKKMMKKMRNSKNSMLIKF